MLKNDKFCSYSGRGGKGRVVKKIIISLEGVAFNTVLLLVVSNYSIFFVKTKKPTPPHVRHFGIWSLFSLSISPQKCLLVLASLMEVRDYFLL